MNPRNRHNPADRMMFNLVMGYGAMLCGPVGWAIWLSALCGATGPAPKR
jgi:hypothetical protein